MEDQIVDATHARPEEEPERRLPITSVLKIELPPQRAILAEARSLISDRDMRLAKLSNICSEDPVITLELLRLSNAMFFSGDRPAITSVRTALVRLGAGTVTELFDALADRPHIASPQVAAVFETLRDQSTQVSVVAQSIASVTHRDLSESTQIAGLFSYVGYLVACLHFGETYLELMTGRTNASLAYKLQQDHHFDLKTIQLNYLRDRGIPKELFYALDRDLQCKTPAQANLRFIVQSAIELVEAAANGRWEKYSAHQPLPSKSNLRMLKLSEYQLSEIFELVGAHLVKEQQPAETPVEASHGALSPVVEFTPAPPPQTIIAPEILVETPVVAPSVIVTETKEPTDLHASSHFLSHEESQSNPDESALSEEGHQVIGQLRDMCRACKTTHDALTGVLKLLTTVGPYERAALVVLGSERHSASVHTSVGTFADGGKIHLDDPLSPLALCLTKINSFNAPKAEDPSTPFGVTSYAISPLRLPDNAPALLYADCGTEESVPMEARRIFRLAVGILNSILPQLPGGLPQRPTVTIATAR